MVGDAQGAPSRGPTLRTGLVESVVAEPNADSGDINRRRNGIAAVALDRRLAVPTLQDDRVSLDVSLCAATTGAKEADGGARRPEPIQRLEMLGDAA